MDLLPKTYSWLQHEPAPKILLEAITLYGVRELIGANHNETILKWAKEYGGWVADYYTADEIAWCGLFMGICAKRAGFPFNQKILSAKAWLEWGSKQEVAMLGDVLVFTRKGGGHVGFYIGEDEACYHVLGGNQGNAVSITRIDKKRLAGIRRCIWKVAQPPNIRTVILQPEGAISKNEA